jgi:hypothetical protein
MLNPGGSHKLEFLFPKRAKLLFIAVKPVAAQWAFLYCNGEVIII